MGIDQEYALVQEFHKTFTLPQSDTPTMLTPSRGQQRCEWMREEIQEFLDAATIDQQADAMIDLMYFALGTMVEMGIAPETLFSIVHQANMKKLCVDGNPLYSETTKVVKPPSWQDPAPLLIQAIQLQRKR